MLNKLRIANVRARPDVDGVVDELLGGGTGKPAAAKPAAKPAGPKATKPAGPSATKGAGKFKPSTPAEVKGYLAKGKEGKAAAKPAAKPAAPKAAAKPAGKPATKPAAAKKPTASVANRAARGEGKFYFGPDEKAELVKALGKLKKPTTTKEYATAHELPTWQVRLAAVALVQDGKMKLVKDGSVLTMQPK